MSEKEVTGLYAYGVLYESPRYKAWLQGRPQRFSEYRGLWSQRVTSKDPGSLPLNLNVEVTTRCNLACTFCSNPTLEKEQVGDLDIELFTLRLREAGNSSIPAVNLNGLGEPTLRSDLASFVKASKDVGVVDVMFHTNGTQLHRSQGVDELLAAGVDRIIVSVDSPDEKTYEAMRLVKGAWDSENKAYRTKRRGSPHSLLVRNTRLLIERAKEHGDSPVVRVTCVLTDKTVEQMEEFVSFWINEGADVITYQDLAWHDKLVQNDSRIPAWESSEKPPDGLTHEQLSTFSAEEVAGFSCPPLFQSMWIQHNGEVVPCSHPDARYHMVMGDLTTRSIEDVWNGDEYQALRAMHTDGTWIEHPVCGRCEIPVVEIMKTRTGGGTLARRNIAVEQD